MKSNYTYLYCLFMLLTSGHLFAQALQLSTGAIVETASDSRSVNFLDVNKDGWEDIFISNGLNGGQMDLLYLNNGDGTFSSVNNTPIVDANNPSDGASFADFNNDGYIDGIVSSWYGAEDLLFLNDGNGALQYHPNAGITSSSFAETAAFGDFNNDGWLDLYITNSGGNKKNFLYQNLQNGSFQIQGDHPLAQEAKLSRGVIWGDFNSDGFSDLFVANEGNASNDLFFGTGNGNFEKVLTGNVVQTIRSSMTSSWGDIDNDGDFDLFVGNSGYFSPQSNQLFKNEGDNNFVEISDLATNGSHCTFGSAFGDYDNDGDLDLIITNGFCNTNLSNILYENQGDGTFSIASEQLSLNEEVCSFGVAWGDINNDGFLDLMIANCKNNATDSQKANSLYINQGNSNNWLKIKLTGTQSNTSAVGAKLRVKATINGQAVWQIREIRAQSGYAAQNSLTAHFGIADATQVDSLIILWPSGIVQILEDVDVNQQLDLSETPNSTPSSTGLTSLQFKVYPNPIDLDTTCLQVAINGSPKAQNASLQLYNAMGQQLLQHAIRISPKQSIHCIPLESRMSSKGVYYLKIQLANGQVWSQKVLAQ